jgi:hypothetical protein
MTDRKIYKRTYGDGKVDYEIRPGYRRFNIFASLAAAQARLAEGMDVEYRNSVIHDEVVT